MLGTEPDYFPAQQPLLWNSNLNLFPNEPLFLRVCCTSLSKTLWQKEKKMLSSLSFFTLHRFWEKLRALDLVNFSNQSFPDFFLNACKYWPDIWHGSQSPCFTDRVWVSLAPSTFGEIRDLGLSKFQWSNSFPHFFFSTLANIDLVFGMEVSLHVLQIEFDFRYAPSIFGEITDLALSKFQQSNSFLHFFPKRLPILSWFFGMLVNHHDLQIELEFLCTSFIFRGITCLRLGKWWNSFPDFFHTVADIVVIFGMQVNHQHS